MLFPGDLFGIGRPPLQTLLSPSNHSQTLSELKIPKFGRTTCP